MNKLKNLQNRDNSELSKADIDYLFDYINAQDKKESMLLDENKNLQKIVNYDVLTGLPNQFLLTTILKKSIANAIRNNYYAVFILINLDNFKDINLSYGHDIGDEVLQHTANTLSHKVRGGDTVVRVEGDTFGVILEQVHDETIIAKIINNILHSLYQSHLLTNEVKINLHASAGIVIVPKDSISIEDIHKQAQEALFLAKKEGLSRYRFFTDEITQKTLTKIAYEDAIKNALQDNSFKLHYQPKIDLHTNKIIGAEAFIRWKSTADTYISPSLFIPIADKTGLIHKIGYYVIDEASKQLKKWNDNGYNISVSVNLSVNQIKYQDIPKMVEHALNESSCNPNNLELEMSEDALVQKGEDALEILNALKTQGIKIAIDKYGNGHSSITSLKKFPIDTLKVDNSFFNDRELTEAIIHMGKALHLQVIGTKVESTEDMDFLKENGCDIYQGYVHSKAVEASEFEELLETQAKA